MRRHNAARWIHRILYLRYRRSRVRLWRERGWLNVTVTTRRLLEYWPNPERDRRLFFCQIEALDTAIYLSEAAAKSGDVRLRKLQPGKQVRSSRVLGLRCIVVNHWRDHSDERRQFGHERWQFRLRPVLPRVSL